MLCSSLLPIEYEADVISRIQFFESTQIRVAIIVVGKSQSNAILFDFERKIDCRILIDSEATEVFYCRCKFDAVNKVAPLEFLFMLESEVHTGSVQILAASEFGIILKAITDTAPEIEETGVRIGEGKSKTSGGVDEQIGIFDNISSKLAADIPVPSLI